MQVIIQGLRRNPRTPESGLRQEAARILRLPPDTVRSIRILRRSLDARKEPVFLYTVQVELPDETADFIRKRIRTARPSDSGKRPSDSGKRPFHSAQRRSGPVIQYPEVIPPYCPPLLHAGQTHTERPIVVGAGPAGLFAALALAQAGLRPILLERGKPVEQRRDDVESFRRNGILNPDSNIQFGEGGAGTFSDGKLNTGTRDPRHRFILEQFVKFGAPPEILFDAKPHIGTDYLFSVLRNFRRALLAMGTDIRFRHTLTGIRTRGNQIAAVTLSGPDGQEIILPCSCLILAPGHSARDTFAFLHRTGVPMEAKAFAVGVRIEHRQTDMDAAQYRQWTGSPGLPPSAYKLSCHLPAITKTDALSANTSISSGNRGVFSFCVCPGGEVVAAASESGGVVTNGMSRFARDGPNINGALLVSLTPDDFGGHTDPLAGIAFQRQLEQAAFRLANGGDSVSAQYVGYLAPAQRVGDFLSGVPSDGPGRVAPTYRPGVVWTDLRLCLPPLIADSLADALPILGRRLHGFDHPDAVLTAVESRSSSPVRVRRDETYQSELRGLFPCGEGAGYAGGILSAAADGLRCAEALIASLYA